MTRLVALTQRAWAAISKRVGTDELLLGGALALIAAGFWFVWRPASFLVPGFVLLWLALPSRTPFVTRPPVAPSRSTPAAPASLRRNS